MVNIMKYKKVYVEITNVCNLNCPFCSKHTRRKTFMPVNKFERVLKKLENHTEYLYFHVLGEPLYHPLIDELIDLASKNFKVNITTNGYLIKRIKDNKNIRQLNISLHSFNEIYGKSLDEYLSDIFEVTDELSKYTYISYRLWVNSKYSGDILESLNKKYNANLKLGSIKNNSTIAENIFISTHEMFTWPNDSEYLCDKGNCYALKDHIGILVDGSVVPCCLDSDGKIKLGNIYKDDISDIVNSERYQNILKGFQENRRVEDLCRHCNFK